MVEITSFRPLAAVLVSVVATAAIVASHRRPNVREGWTILAAVSKFAIVASMLPAVLGGTVFVSNLGVFLPGLETSIDFTLRADPLGMLFATLASLLWIITSFYSIGYMRGLEEHGQTRYFASFAMSLAAAVGIAFAGNLVTIFVFYELLSIATYPLVAHDETDEARSAGRKYLAYTFFGGGVLVLAGTVLVFWLTGTVAFTPGGIAELAAADPWAARATFALLAVGFGVKAGLMPLHQWLPEAMVAPTPVSGLLHAVAVVKSGAFGVARVVLEVFGPELAYELGMGVALAALAAFTLTAASLIAIRKDHLKQRLAYSTVSQLSYIVLGLGIFGWHGLVGALLHIPAHAFMKLTLFFCAGAIHVETHTDYISQMAGIGKRMPVTMGAFTLAAAGMAGMPLLAGFVSKYYMLVGAVGMGLELTPVALYLAGALLLSGVLNIAYFWPVVYTAFFEAEDAHDAKPLVDYRLGGESRSTLAIADGGGRDGSAPVADGGSRNGQAPAADGDGRDGPAPATDSDDGESDDCDVSDDGAKTADEDISDGETDPELPPDGVVRPDFGATERDYGEPAPLVDGEYAVDRYPSDHVAADAADHVAAAADDEDDAAVERTTRDEAPGEGHARDEHHGDHGHHGGPPPGGWERVALGTETTWFMLGPILAAVTGAVVLGVVPDHAVFLRLIEVIVEGTGVTP